MTALLTGSPPTLVDFDGHNGQFTGGRAVHAVAPQPWIGDLLVPGPACHTPSGSFDPATFRPAHGVVTCLRCLRSPDTRAAAAPLVDPDQLALPIEPDGAIT